MTEAARSTDHHYSNSMFVIEVDGRPTAIFETKWHMDAELSCRTWEQLMVKGHGQLKMLPVIKLRLARPDETAAYAVENATFEVQEGTRIVYLRQLVSSSDRAESNLRNITKSASAVVIHRAQGPS